MHLAIIMDGNGRWAIQKGLSRLEGHKKGSETLKDISLYCSEKKKKCRLFIRICFFCTKLGKTKRRNFCSFFSY